MDLEVPSLENWNKSFLTVFLQAQMNPNTKAVITYKTDTLNRFA